MKTSLRTFVAAGLLVATLGVSASAHAQTTVHTSLADFLANTQSGAYAETFSSALESGSPSKSFASMGFGYTVSAPTGIYLNGGSSGFIGTNLDNDLLTFTFTSGNVTAVGGNWFATNIGDVFSSSLITILLSNGTTTSYTPSSAAGFRGFTTTGAVITSLTLSAPGATLYNNADNVIVGSTSSNVVPEPSTYVLMATGLLGLIGVARRRSVVR